MRKKSSSSHEFRHHPRTLSPTACLCNDHLFTSRLAVASRALLAERKIKCLQHGRLTRHERLQYAKRQSQQPLAGAVCFLGLQRLRISSHPDQRVEVANIEHKGCLLDTEVLGVGSLEPTLVLADSRNRRPHRAPVSNSPTPFGIPDCRLDGSKEIGKLVSRGG